MRAGSIASARCSRSSREFRICWLPRDVRGYGRAGEIVVQRAVKLRSRHIQQGPGAPVNLAAEIASASFVSLQGLQERSGRSCRNTMGLLRGDLTLVPPAGPGVGLVDEVVVNPVSMATRTGSEMDVRETTSLRIFS